MKHCEACVLDFPDGYRFCGSCGGPLSDSRRCPGCGELVEGKWTFCTSCGGSLSSGRTGDQPAQVKTPERIDLPAVSGSSTPAPTPPPQTLSLPLSEQSVTADRLRSEKATSQEWYSAPDLLEETTTTAAPAVPRQALVPKTIAPTPQVTMSRQGGDEKSAPSLTMLSAYGEPEAPSQFRWWQGAILAVFFLLIVGGIGIGGWYWWSHRASVAQVTPSADSNNAPAPESSATFPSPTSTSTITSAQTITSNSADQEIKLLRQRRTGAKPSESAEIIAAFQGAEKKYPTDYRFPYERAKLSIAGVASHHEAFGALALAAEKAIDNGKTQEMLDSLMADRDGDFHKLSRGHREWQVLEEALRNKDRASLTVLHH